MFRFIVALFLLALISGFLGFSGLAASFSWGAQVLTVVFIVLAIAGMLVDATRTSSRPV